MRRLMARKPAVGDPVTIDGTRYQVATESPLRRVVYAENACGCEWLLLDRDALRWDFWRRVWRADRTAVLAAGATQ